MALPPETAAALRMVPAEILPGPLADDERACDGAQFHSPTPLVLHKVDLPDGRRVTLCGCCRDNVGVLVALVKTYGLAKLEWPLRREFGNRLRQLVIPKEGDDGG